MKKMTGFVFLILFLITNLFSQELPENLELIKVTKTTGPNAEKLFQDLDKTYLEVYKAWEKYGSIYNKAASTGGTIDKKNVILDKVSQIRQNTQNSIDALEPFKPIPVIGSVVNGSQMALKTTARQMDRVKGKLEGFNNTVLNPVAGKANELTNSVRISEEEVYQTLKLLFDIKTRAAAKCNCIVSGTNQTTKMLFEQGSAKVSAALTGYGNSFSDIGNEEGKLNTINNAVNKLNPVFDKTINGLDTFMSKFKASRKAVHEVNKVLDKRFKKKVFGKKISISVRDVLTGGGALKKAKKWLKKIKVDIDKWARKALDPVAKKLGAKLPGLPGFDNYYKKANELKNKVDEFGKISNSLLENKKSVADYRKKLSDISEAQILNILCKDKSEAIADNIPSEYNNIQNRWKKTHIHIERGGLECGKIAPGWHSAMWIFEPVKGTEYVKIKNRWKNTYLHIEHGKVECGKIASGWHSAMWKIQRVPGTEYFNITNRWKGTSIHIEHGKVECGRIAPGWHSAMWQMKEPPENK